MNRTEVRRRMTDRRLVRAFVRRLLAEQPVPTRARPRKGASS